MPAWQDQEADIFDRHPGLMVGLLAEAFRATAGTSVSTSLLGLLSQSAGCHSINEGVHGGMKGMETGEHFTQCRVETLEKSQITGAQKDYSA